MTTPTATRTRQPAAKAVAAKKAPARKRVAVAGTSQTVSRKKAASFARTDEATARSRLAALIPEPTGYISRQVRGIPDLEMFAIARAQQQNLLLRGDTGAGKSMFIEAFCAVHEIPLVVINCHGGIDPNTFWGMLEMDPESRAIRWVDSDISLAMEYGPAVVFFDEVNFTPPRTFSVFHSAMRQRFWTILERNNEKRLVHPETTFVAAYNPEDKYEGTRPLNKAFRNRFTIKLKWGYDKDTEKRLSSLPILLEIATGLRSREQDYTTPIATNMLIEFEDVALQYMDYGQKVALDFTIENFIEAFKPGDEQDAVRKIFVNNRSVLDKQFADFYKSLNS